MTTTTTYDGSAGVFVTPLRGVVPLPASCSSHPLAPLTTISKIAPKIITVKTASGGRWHATTVAHVIARLAN